MPKAKCLALGHMANEGQSKRGENCGSLPSSCSALLTAGGCELWRRSVLSLYRSGGDPMQRLLKDRPLLIYCLIVVLNTMFLLESRLGFLFEGRQ